MTRAFRFLLAAAWLALLPRESAGGPGPGPGPTPLRVVGTPLRVVGTPLRVVGTPTRAVGTPLASSRTLLARLGTHGRATVALRWDLKEEYGPARPVHATLALEPPGLARVDVVTTGEKVTLRADGGEWLQPAARQMLRLSPAHAGLALRWWRVLVSGRGATERRLANGAHRLEIPAAGDVQADSADVWLDAAGLPTRLDTFEDEDGPRHWRLSRWAFAKARGPRAFRLLAPAGFETIALP